MGKIIRIMNEENAIIERLTREIKDLEVKNQTVPASLEKNRATAYQAFLWAQGEHKKVSEEFDALVKQQEAESNKAAAEKAKAASGSGGRRRKTQRKRKGVAKSRVRRSRF